MTRRNTCAVAQLLRASQTHDQRSNQHKAHNLNLYSAFFLALMQIYEIDSEITAIGD